MPSSGTINSASKSKIKAALPSATYKILTATVARVYAAHPDPDTWSYTGIEGGLAFVKLAATGGTGFRVVDLKVSRIAPSMRSNYQILLCASNADNTLYVIRNTALVGNTRRHLGP